MMAVQIIHGSNLQSFDGIEGTTIAEIKTRLRDVLNLSPEVNAYCDGDLASVHYLVEDGDVIEFVRIQGSKGLGRLLTPEELVYELKISNEDYTYFLNLGLPIIKNSSGADCHSEIAVDDFFKSLHEKSGLEEKNAVSQDGSISEISVSNKELEWDGRKISLNGKMICRYKNAAEHQAKILRSFQDNNWIHEISDPFELDEIEKKSAPGKKNAELIEWQAKRRAAIAELNKKQNIIKFTSSGHGFGVKWEWRENVS
ncbi:hypothetical protein [Gimesia maris]|uniref:hypothetical protein n=1 Tax=Gimesia maris TaxID=122 RepID=UPI0030D96F00|tara:strand:- start:357 stop:1124 length:768 start_codon:yes stop_codon:yes gene_type:complete